MSLLLSFPLLSLGVATYHRPGSMNHTRQGHLFLGGMLESGIGRSPIIFLLRPLHMRKGIHVFMLIETVNLI